MANRANKAKAAAGAVAAALLRKVRWALHLRPLHHSRVAAVVLDHVGAAVAVAAIRPDRSAETRPDLVAVPVRVQASVTRLDQSAVLVLGRAGVIATTILRDRVVARARIGKIRLGRAADLAPDLTAILPDLGADPVGAIPRGQLAVRVLGHAGVIATTIRRDRVVALARTGKIRLGRAADLALDLTAILPALGVAQVGAIRPDQLVVPVAAVGIRPVRSAGQVRDRAGTTATVIATGETIVGVTAIGGMAAGATAGGAIAAGTTVVGPA